VRKQRVIECGSKKRQRETKFAIEGEKRSAGKEFVEWEKGLKHWGQERIIERALGARKPGKGSCPYVFYFHLILLWMIIGLNV